MILYLVRHCEYANPRNIIPGRLPVELSPEGKQHAHQLQAFFAPKSVTALYSSAVKRCQQTSQIIVQDHQPPIPIIYDQRLLEGHFAYQGYWVNHAQHAYGHYPELGGESRKDVYTRVVEFYQQAIKPHSTGNIGNVIVCSHGDPIYFLSLYLAGRPLPPDDKPGETPVAPADYPKKGQVMEFEL